ncbi:nucleotide sugar dehydrogenase [Amylibacter sp.]|jgi:UDP-N-acetyl-D-glucosamine dehydrogenase|nr:nucleotide sugar dehydrogenase [Amylibacter sp.]
MTQKHSISAITGEKYNIPAGSDIAGLAQFLEQNVGKQVVAIQGLGFVGTAMSLVVANNEDDQYAVIGVDQASQESYWKIAAINDGVCPIISSDPLIYEFFAKAKQKNNLYATYDPIAFSYADVIIVDINLDVTKVKDELGNIESYDVPLDGFKKAIQAIGEVCKEDVLILIETTIPPGTCKKIIHPTISDSLKLRGLSADSFKLGHSYERVMPGPNYINSIKNFYRVYSGIDVASAKAVEYFLKTVISTDEYPLTRLKTTESTEMAKVLENSYRAMNISFAIEWSRFAESSGVDLYEVIDAIRQRPTHANLMYPGIGVGGYCLTKDPLMASWASENFFGLNSGLQSSVKAVEDNDKMPMYCFDFVREILRDYDKNSLKIGLLGVAYGPGIGDTRFSPVEDFYKRLSMEFADIECQDPYVAIWAELNLEIETSLSTFIDKNFDVLVITTGHKDYVIDNAIYDLIANSEKKAIIIDTVGLLDLHQLPIHYSQNNNFFVLGVGHNED